MLSHRTIKHKKKKKKLIKQQFFSHGFLFGQSYSGSNSILNKKLGYPINKCFWLFWTTLIIHIEARVGPTQKSSQHTPLEAIVVAPGIKKKKNMKEAEGW